MREDQEPLQPGRTAAPAGGADADAVSGLLFDEADPLLGRRADVTDAHDRYANVETSLRNSEGDHLRALEPGRYRHFTGRSYELIGIARHSEDDQEFVVYRALYGDAGLWVRPRAMWDEPVQRDGYRGPRFVREE